MGTLAIVAIRFSSGQVGRMQIFTEMDREEDVEAPHRISESAALENGFTLTVSGGKWVRDLTDEVITREIARTTWAADLGEFVGFERVASHEEFESLRGKQ